MTRVVAIVAAYNEADIIEATTKDLIAQGVEVYLLDNGSTDGTAEVVRPLLGQGVIAIEPFPPQDGVFALRRLMARKQELASTIEADWFINHDADELRESPWRTLRLPEALSVVDRMGFNAVDFAVLNFPPVDDGYRPGVDLREAFPFFEPGQAFDAVQIRCWKRQPRVDLEYAGGHDVQFPGRRVFPIRFLLRHYPIRSQAHGERKVFVDRLPRFSTGERAESWHVQYNGIAPGHRFVRDPSTLVRFDPDLVRAQVCIDHRGVEEERERFETFKAAAEATSNSLREDITRLSADLSAMARQAEALAADRDAACRERDALDRELRACEGRVAELRSSVSWRLTAPLRWVFDRVRGA